MWIPEFDDRENDTWATENDVVFEAFADGPSLKGNVLEEDIGSTERRHAVMLGRELRIGEFLALGGDGERAVGILQQRAKIDESSSSSVRSGDDDDEINNSSSNNNNNGSGVDRTKRASRAAAIAFFSERIKKDTAKEEEEEEEKEEEEERKEEGIKKKKKETLYERYMRIKSELEEVKGILCQQGEGGADSPMYACVQEISERLERMPDTVFGQTYNVVNNKEEEEEDNNNNVVVVNENEKNKEEEEEEREKNIVNEENDNEDDNGSEDIMIIVRRVDKKLREVEESIGLPGDGDFVRMPDVNVLFAHLMSVTRAQTERLRARLANAQATLNNNNNNNNINKLSSSSSSSSSPNEGDRACIEHLHDQLEGWEATMRALPLIAERLRSLVPVERCARSAESSVDRILREQYQSLDALREVRSGLLEVERCLGENRAVIESNIQYICDLVSASPSESQ